MDCVKQRFRGRASAIDAIFALLDDDECAAPFIHVSGAASTGKTAVVGAVLEQLWETAELRSAVVDCAALGYAPKLLFESIANQLARHVPAAENSYQNYARCKNVRDFIQVLATFHETFDAGNLVLVFDRIDALAHANPPLFAAVLALPKLLGEYGNLTNIFLSRQPWAMFTHHVRELIAPTEIHFGQYQKADVLAIAEAHWDRTSDEVAVEKEALSLDESDKRRWAEWVNFLYDMVFATYPDVADFLRIAEMCFPLYMDPLTRQANLAGTRLIRLYEPYIHAFCNKIYTREVSEDDWADMMSLIIDADTNDSEGPIAQALLRQRQHIPVLPRQSIYILLAAYLSSYLPASLDGTYFATSGRSSRRSKVATGKRISKAAEQRILGPRAFTIDRCLAILYCIWGDEIGKGAEVQKQLSSLISLKLLTRTTPRDNIDTVKCKCNIGWEHAQRLAGTVRFDLGSYFSQ